jgi:hypothetical protein
MKLVSRILLVITIFFLITGCNKENDIKRKETLGNIKALTAFLPDEKATWTFKGTGNYYHEMTLEDIITSDQSVYYKIKAEILSDNSNSNYEDYLTEVRYIISRKGWQQEIKQSKLLDSKYKGMYLLKFPIEENSTWEEKVLDFNNRQRTIIGKIESIDYIEDKKIITVKYSEKNSDYYEIRKIMAKKGIVEFKKNTKMNEAYHLLSYSLEEFNSNDDSIKSQLKVFLDNYNKAWAKYYNNGDLKILDFIERDSVLESNILSFNKNQDAEITFIDLSVQSIDSHERQYKITVEETFIIKKNGEESIQKNIQKYTLIEAGNDFVILKIE